MRLVFFGSGEFGLPTLRALASAHEVVGVVTQPDRPAGRGRELTPTPIGAWAAANLPGVPLLKPDKVGVPEMVERIRAVPADAWVVIAFGQKLPPALLEGRFAINLHASLLPRWRGAAPINAAILAGDAQTGNSVITLADRMDAGEILAQSSLAIDPGWTAGALHDLLSDQGPPLVLKVLDDYARGMLDRRSQDETLATKAPKLSRADGWAGFASTAEECRRRIHGLTPWPGVTIRLSRSGVAQEIKVLLARAIDAEAARREFPSLPLVGHDPDQVGTLVEPAQGLVRCGAGTLLQLLQVTPAGSRPMAWSAFTHGRLPAPGSRVDGGRSSSGPAKGGAIG